MCDFENIFKMFSLGKFGWN